MQYMYNTCMPFLSTKKVTWFIEGVRKKEGQKERK